MKLETEYRGLQLLFRLFGDPWIAMLAFAQVGHVLDKPALYHISYWCWVLIVVGVQAVWGVDSPTYRLKFDKKLNVNVKEK